MLRSFLHRLLPDDGTVNAIHLNGELPATLDEWMKGQEGRLVLHVPGSSACWAVESQDDLQCFMGEYGNKFRAYAVQYETLQELLAA